MLTEYEMKVTNATNTCSSDTRRILIVENDPTLAETLQVILEEEHHAVETASNGIVGLAMYSIGRHDLVIIGSDISRLSCVELASQIRDFNFDQPIVLTTHHKAAFEENFAASSLFTIVLERPVEIAELRAVATLPFAMA